MNAISTPEHSTTLESDHIHHTKQKTGHYGHTAVPGNKKGASRSAPPQNASLADGCISALTLLQLGPCRPEQACTRAAMHAFTKSLISCSHNPHRP
ncbi:hypothetical protein VYU27_004862 [Nannochloropsis oceanica]